MLKERAELLLSYKVLSRKKDKLVVSSWFKIYWEKYPYKDDIEVYPGESIKENIYRFLKNDHELYTCLWCGEKTKYKTLNLGFDEYCSPKCVRAHVKAKGTFTTQGYTHSNEIKMKMSDNHADVSGDKNPFRNACKKYPILRKQASDRKKKWWADLSDDERDRIGETFSKAQAKNKHRNNHKNHKSGYFNSIKMNSKYFFRSSWEEKICIFLERSDRIRYFSLEEFYIEYDFNGKKRFTRIDFFVKVDNRKIIFEVKPLSLLDYNNNRAKIEGIQKYCIRNNMEFYLIYDSMIKEACLTAIIERRIDNDNFKRFD